jgi:ribosomal protein L35
MPKMKTHKGYKKVSKKKPDGSYEIMPSGNRHNTGTKASKHSLKKRKKIGMSKADQNRIKKMKIG